MKSLSLLNPVDLVKMINTLEKAFPGWWWSIAQRPHAIFIMLAPQPGAPDVYHRGFANTKLGDEGFELVIHTNQYKDVNEHTDTIFSKINYYLSNIYAKVENFKRTTKNIVADKPVSCRNQSEFSLLKFKDRYTEFLEKDLEIISMDHELREVLFGSCNTSIDCSLRGLVKDTLKAFDSSVDYMDCSSILADSLDTAILEIKTKDYESSDHTF